MADYNPNQFEPDPVSLRAAVTAKEKQLEARVRELELEVKKLQGYRKWELTVPMVLTYTTEARTEDEARDWYFKVGKEIVPNSRNVGNIEVEPADE